MKITLILFMLWIASIDSRIIQRRRGPVRILNRTLRPFKISKEERQRIYENKKYEEYLNQVQNATTDEDILQLSEDIFNVDDNNVFNNIRVNLQGNVSRFSPKDEAPDNLLTIPETIWNGPTIAPLTALFDNYHLHFIQPEIETSKEIMEQTTYINAILNTRPIKRLMKFLVNKGLTHLNDRRKQLDLLKKIWFTKYSRHLSGRVKGSCAFEYVFVWELSTLNIISIRSWLYYAKKELDDAADYLGYIDKLDLAGKGMIIKFNAILDRLKRNAPDIAVIVGTSPELETALYTMCFMARPGLPCKLRYNGVNFTLQTKTVKSDNIRLMTTATLDF